MRKSNKANTIFFIIGLIILGYMIHKIGAAAIWQNVVKTGWWFIPVIGSWLIIYSLNALALKEIIFEKDLPNTRLPFLNVLKITISGYAINYITPVAPLGGEPYRIMELKDRLGLTKATSSVLLYTIMHMFSHIVFWLVSIGLILFAFDLTTELLVGCGITFLVFTLLILWVIRMYRSGLTITTFRALSRLPFLQKRINGFIDRNHKSLEEIDRDILELFSQRRGTFYAALAYEFLARVVGCFEIYFVAVAIGAPISIVDSLIVSSGSSLFANMLFFSPMQLATREGGFVLAVQSLGVAAGAGIFISLVTRIRELVWILIGLLLVKIKAK